nr:DeoR/GlpR family DNA-binding transcription regulator [Fusobacterium gastrosuis]
MTEVDCIIITYKLKRKSDTMLFQERISKIMDLLKEKETVSTIDIVRILNISEATARRDLAYLEKENKIKRIFGGATVNRIVKEEISIDMKKDVEIKAKNKIAKIASQFIDDGDCIYLDAGTTTHQLIDFLKEKKVKVVTNGLMHIEKLMKYDIETCIVGGKVKKKTKAIIGARAIEDLSDFSFDKAFMGANGIDESGYMTFDIEEALLKRKAIRQANRAFILADSTKFGIKYFSNIAKLEEATIITDKKDVEEDILKITEVVISK